MLMNVSPKYDLHQHLTNQHTQTRPTFIATYFRQFIGTYESSGHLAKGDQQWWIQVYGGLFNSDTWYPNQLVYGARFASFLKPGRSGNKCNPRWIKACGRPFEQPGMYTSSTKMRVWLQKFCDCRHAPHRLLLWCCLRATKRAGRYLVFVVFLARSQPRHHPTVACGETLDPTTSQISVNVQVCCLRLRKCIEAFKLLPGVLHFQSGSE